MALKVDYADYQLDGDRTYQLTDESGDIQKVQLTDISDYSVVGDTFGAADINATNKAVNDLSKATQIFKNKQSFSIYATSEYSTNNWVEVTLMRQGNVVCCFVKSAASLPAYSANSGFKEYSIPDGYKPAGYVRAVYPCMSATTCLGYGSWGFTQTGGMHIQSNQADKQWCERYANACWITNDDYPS